jgi:hypothetical protein
MPLEFQDAGTPLSTGYGHILVVWVPQIAQESQLALIELQKLDPLQVFNSQNIVPSRSFSTFNFSANTSADNDDPSSGNASKIPISTSARTAPVYATYSLVNLEFHTPTLHLNRRAETYSFNLRKNHINRSPRAPIQTSNTRDQIRMRAADLPDRFEICAATIFDR